MKRILFVNHAESWGGASKCLFWLIKALDPSKYQVTVLFIKKSAVSEKFITANIHVEFANSKFYRIYYEFFPHSEAGYLKWYQLIKFTRLSILWLLSKNIFAPRELSHFDYDILHLNSSVLTDWLISKRGKRIVMHIREPFRKGKVDFLHLFFRTQINKNTDKIIAISEDNYLRIGLNHKTVIVHDFTDVEPKFNSDGYDSKKVLYLGGSNTSKGFFVLVDALQYLKEDIQILFAGHYHEKKHPKNPLGFFKYYLSNSRKRNIAIRKVKNSKNCKIVGLIEDVSYYIDEVGFIVSPFIVPHFSLPVVEAQLRSKPAIGSNIEGMTEIIQNDVSGLIFKNKDSVYLARQINLLANNPRLARELGQAGYRIASEKFTKKNIKILEKVYENMVTLDETFEE